MAFCRRLEVTLPYNSTAPTAKSGPPGMLWPPRIPLFLSKQLAVAQVAQLRDRKSLSLPVSDTKQGI